MMGGQMDLLDEGPQTERVHPRPDGVQFVLEGPLRAHPSSARARYRLERGFRSSERALF